MKKQKNKHVFHFHTHDYFANYWVHNGFVTFDKEKMSKSLGNIVTIRKLRENINGQVIRLALLSAHYKQPLDWNEKLIKDSQNTLDKWYNQFEKDDSEEINEELLKPLLAALNKLIIKRKKTAPDHSLSAQI